MTSTSQKWLRFYDLEGQSEMSTLEKTVKFLQSSWEILNFSLPNGEDTLPNMKLFSHA